MAVCVANRFRGIHPERPFIERAFGGGPVFVLSGAANLRRLNSTEAAELSDGFFADGQFPEHNSSAQEQDQNDQRDRNSKKP
jgi:hypothetical protein